MKCNFQAHQNTSPSMWQVRNSCHRRIRDWWRFPSLEAHSSSSQTQKPGNAIAVLTEGFMQHLCFHCSWIRSCCRFSLCGILWTSPHVHYIPTHWLLFALETKHSICQQSHYRASQNANLNHMGRRGTHCFHTAVSVLIPPVPWCWNRPSISSEYYEAE